MVHQFIKRLATPFDKWKAYDLGVIDKQGNILIPDADRNAEQKKAFGKFDLMVLKLKKLLAKVPGGSSKLASYMAALWLIKEWNHFSSSSSLNEQVSDSDLDFSISLFLEWYLYYIPIVTNVNRKIDEEGESPTNNVGGGDIAGLGIGPQGEPGLTKLQQIKHRRRAATSNRFHFQDILNKDNIRARK